MVKELKEIFQRRVILDEQGEPADVTQLTEIEKKQAHTCRLLFSIKRPTLEEEAKGEEGRHKCRLVARDLKCFNQRPASETYSAVPTVEAFRMLIASCDMQTDLLSTTDFTTAFLQAFRWEEGKKLLIKFWEPFKNDWVYCWINGVLYGDQRASREFHQTLTTVLTKELGFTEGANMESIYHHHEKGITMACHVDDPFIKCKDLAGQTWIHDQLQSKFDTKGAAYLTPGTSLDYLSIRVTLHMNGDLTLDNQLKIEKYLDEHNLTQCNPTAEPLTKHILKEIGDNIANELKVAPEEEMKLDKMLGELQ